VKILSDILYKCRIKEVLGSTSIAIDDLELDSRKVRPMTLFIALRGHTADGHLYIDQAIQSGANSIVCEFLPENLNENITYIVVQDSAESLGTIAANFFDNPSEELKVVAITGTNGKTTTATLLFDLFKSLGHKSGLLSTVVNLIGNQKIEATHTTPDAISINRLLRQMIKEGCKYCFMEASSHAIHQRRVAGIQFTGALFTNITHDHLDYHQTFNEYIKAKKQLFDELPTNAFALINEDDRHGEIMIQNTNAKVKSYAMKTMADYKAKVLENQFSGLQINIDGKDLYSRLIGGFNAYNLLSVYCIAVELGIDHMEVLTHLSSLTSVEGRFQYIKTDKDVTAVIDYAHTPDALKNVLSTIADIRTGNEKVITVVGCGGDRDADKRPVMAKIAAELSDQAILTSDNPRSENPQTILDDMNKGLDPILMKRSLSVLDRKEAIKLACTLAEDGDIILIAGKGHEKYQEVMGEKLPFDDLQIVNETLKMLEK